MNTSIRSSLALLMGTYLFAGAASAQFTHDARILEYTGLRYACNGGATPVLKIQNVGSATMGTCVVETWKNGLMVNSFNWLLAVPATVGSVRQPALPAVPDLSVDDVLEFRIISVNEQPDEDATGNVLQQQMNEVPAFAESHVVMVEVLTDAAPQETTWVIRNAAGTIVASGGPYASASAVEEIWIDLEPSGCFDLRVTDGGGNGLAGGYVKLFSNGAEVAAMSVFTASEARGFETGTVTAVAESVADGALSVFPVPTTDMLLVRMPQGVAVSASVQVVDAMGRAVTMPVRSVGEQLGVDLEAFAPGTYVVVLRDATGAVHRVRAVRE
ncbi:MAG: T9SS type A sorting domain-containing protein [Flavobacteriales bacterium]|jgi:hypothetical protein